MIEKSQEFREAIKDLFPRLWRYCFILAKNRSKADDLAQAACLRALEHEHQFQIGTRLDRWIFRIAQTIWLNQLRALKIREGGGILPPEEIALAGTAADSETILYLSQVLSTAMELPEPQRSVIFLVCVEGYSYKDAADHLGVPLGTVMSRLSSARAKLTASLGRNLMSRTETGEAE
jgi:RNA polymerase sigma-70 factor (ECF subfamily)